VTGWKGRRKHATHDTWNLFLNGRQEANSSFLHFTRPPHSRATIPNVK
jgi:hypothetical protein